MTNFLNYVCWEHECNKVWNEKFEAEIMPFIKAYFPSGHELKLDNHSSIQNLLAFYSNFMKFISKEHPYSHQTSIMLKLQGLFKTISKNHVEAINQLWSLWMEKISFGNSDPGTYSNYIACYNITENDTKSYWSGWYHQWIL